MAEPSSLSGDGATRSRGRRIALYLVALLVSAVLAGLIARVGPQVRPALLTAILVLLAGGGGALLSIPLRRRLRAANPAPYRTANPAAIRRARRLRAAGFAWSLLWIAGLGALWGTGHLLIAAVVLISYFALLYPVLLAVMVLARHRRSA